MVLTDLEGSQIYIVGAQSRAKTLTGYLKEVYKKVLILGYLVDDLSENEKIIDGVPVLLLSSENILKKDATVFIATKGIYHEVIIERLKAIGFSHIIPVSVEVDNFLRNEYVKSIFLKENRKFQKFDEMCANIEVSDEREKKDACIYVAKSIYDRPLDSIYNAPSYECSIQVGAALTDERLTDEFGKPLLTDSEGDNISSQNRQYSELTALYWAWKHTTNPIVGIAHYRRHFILRSDWIECMEKENIDVILPVPTCVLPNIADNYKERHDASDWEYMIDYLKRNHPDEAEGAEYIFGRTLYLPCNMFIAKREILNAMCEWMFPILDAVVAHGGVKEDVYQNRYAGFVSERLITLFFHLHQNDYKIVYADRTFLR